MKDSMKELLERQAASDESPKQKFLDASFMIPSGFHGEIAACQPNPITRANREGIKEREGRHEGDFFGDKPPMKAQEEVPSCLLHEPFTPSR